MNDVINAFKSLKENYSDISVIKYYDKLKDIDPDVLLENSQFIFSEPAKGTDFLKAIIISNDLSISELEKQKGKLSQYITNCNDGKYKNTNHISKLKECCTFIDNKINDGDVKSEMILEFYSNKLPKSMHTNEIKNSLGKLKVAVESYDLYSTYESMCDELNHRGFNFKSSGIAPIFKSIFRDFILDPNMNNLQLKDSLNYVKENIINADPTPQEKENVIGILKYIKSDYDDIDNIVDGIIDELSNDISKIEDIWSMSPDDVFNEYTEEQLTSYLAHLEATAQNQILDMFINDNVTLESLTDLTRNLNQYAYLDILTEGKITKIARKAALKVEKGTQKYISSIKKKGQELKSVSVVAKRIPGHVDTFVNTTINDIKKLDTDERRRRIIEGNFRFKFFKILRDLTIAGSLSMVGTPITGGLYLITSAALHAKTDNKVRNEILRELQAELKLVEEKIDDAKSDGNKKEKYQLMRLKDKLENDIERIKFRIDK